MPHSAATDDKQTEPLRLSIIMEWANAQLAGVSRAEVAIRRVAEQWSALINGEYPPTLEAAGREFLDRIERRPELIVVSGETEVSIDSELLETLSKDMDVAIHSKEGLQYYPLKSFGAEQAQGDLLLFVDSDVWADDHWLAFLLATFADPDIHACSGQAYVPPRGIFGKAYALGWIFDVRDESGGIVRAKKFFTNNLAFRAPLFRQVGFPSIGGQSRGAAGLLRKELEAMGLAVWENRAARVDHPAPTGFGHLVYKSLGEGRDHYLRAGSGRNLKSLSAAIRLGCRRWWRGLGRSFRHWRAVNMRIWEYPAVLFVMSLSIGIMIGGGIMTFLAPDAMSARFKF